jgi:hypothetical protein
MRTALSIVAVIATLFASVAEAQVYDHLECFKIQGTAALHSRAICIAHVDRVDVRLLLGRSAMGPI